MRTIHKQGLSLERNLLIQVPEGTTFLHIANQYGQPVLWYLCDPSEPLVERTLLCYGTGHKIDAPVSKAEYIGTAILEKGDLILHWFEEKP